MLGVFVFFYYQVKLTVPQPLVTLAGQTVSAQSWKWEEPVFGAFLSKTVTGTNPPSAQLELKDAQVALVIPQEYQGEMKLYQNGNTAPIQSAFESTTFHVPQNGDYELQITLRTKANPRKNHQPSGIFHYRIPFSMQSEPVITLSSEKVAQGDLLTITVENIQTQAIPVIQTPLSPSIFVPTEHGFSAYVAVAYNREIGTYPISIQIGPKSYERSVQVVSQNFPKRTITPFVQTGSLQEWKNAIFPFYDRMTPQKQWTLPFSAPSLVLTSADYGAFLYSEQQEFLGRSSGIRYDTLAGDVLLAPSGGTVVYAQPLSWTGGTVIIDHGGGLKSYFYYLGEITCQAGDVVTTGTPIGKAGNQFVQYETRIGNQSFNPTVLFEKSSARTAS